MVAGEDHIEESVAPYVLGALERDEVELVELHLLWCDACRSLVEEERQVVRLLPYLPEPVSVPIRARRQLLARVRSEEEPDDELAPRRRIPALVARLGWVAAASIAVVALVFAWNNTQMQAQVDKKDSEVGVVEQQRGVLIDVVSSGDGHTATLQGTGAAAGVKGGVILDPTSNAALMMLVGLPEPKPGKSYVVWMVQGSRHVNAGLLPVDDQGRGQLYITSDEPIANFDGITVTEETSPMVANPSSRPLITARVER